MQALSEKMMHFQQKHSAFAVAMNNSSCSIPIARSMQKKALSSPELGAFLLGRIFRSRFARQLFCQGSQGKNGCRSVPPVRRGGSLQG